MSWSSFSGIFKSGTSSNDIVHVSTDEVLKHFEPIMAEKELTPEVLEKYKDHARYLRDWINTAIRSRGTQVADPADMKNGIALIRLLEVLSGKTLDGYLKAPVTVLDCLKNLEMFLRGVMTVGVATEGVTSEDIYMGRLPELVPLLLRLAERFKGVPLPSSKKEKKKEKKPTATGVIGVILDDETLSQIHQYVRRIESGELATPAPPPVQTQPSTEKLAASSRAGSSSSIEASSSTTANPMPVERPAPRLLQIDEKRSASSLSVMAKLETFTIVTSDSVKKVVYNPATFLEDLLLRICEVRDVSLSDCTATFMDGTLIPKLNVTLAELGVHEIKFLEKDKKKVKREKSSNKKERVERHSLEFHSPVPRQSSGGVTSTADFDLHTALGMFETGEMLVATPLKWHTLLQNLLALESWRTHFIKKNGFNHLFEALGFIENRLRLNPAPQERTFTQLSMCLYCLQALANQQTPVLRTSFPVRLLLDAFRFTDSDYTVVLFDLITKLFVVEGNVPYILVAIKYFLFAEADTFSEMIEELKDHSTPMLYRTEFLGFLTSILAASHLRADRDYLRDEFWKAGLTYNAICTLSSELNNPDWRESAECYLDEAELYDGYVPSYLLRQDADEYFSTEELSPRMDEPVHPPPKASQGAAPSSMVSSHSQSLIMEISSKGRIEKQQEEAREAISAFELAVSELMDVFPTAEINKSRAIKRRLTKTSARQSIPRLSSTGLSGSSDAESALSAERVSDVSGTRSAPSLQPSVLTEIKIVPRSATRTGIKASKSTWTDSRSRASSQLPPRAGTLIDRVQYEILDAYNPDPTQVADTIKDFRTLSSSEVPLYTALHNILMDTTQVTDAINTTVPPARESARDFLKQIVTHASYQNHLDLLIFQSQISSLTGSRTLNLRKVKQTLSLLEVPQYKILLAKIQSILNVEGDQFPFDEIASLYTRRSQSNPHHTLLQQLVTDLEADDHVTYDWARSTTQIFTIGTALTALHDMSRLFVQKLSIINKEISASPSDAARTRLKVLADSVTTQMEHMKSHFASIDETLFSLGVVFTISSSLPPQWKSLVDSNVIDLEQATELSSQERIREKFSSTMNSLFTNFERAVYQLHSADSETISEHPLSPRIADLGDRPSADVLRARALKLKLTDSNSLSNSDTDFNLGAITRRGRQSALTRKQVSTAKDTSDEEASSDSSSAEDDD